MFKLSCIAMPVTNGTLTKYLNTIEMGVLWLEKKYFKSALKLF